MLDTLAVVGRMSPFALVFIPTPVAPVTPVAPTGAMDPNKALNDIVI
jgi:hypothetical protein